MILSYILVFLLAAIPLFELITVIPLAIIGGLSPVLTAIVAFLGNALTVVLLIVFVDQVKKWMKKRKQKKRMQEIIHVEEVAAAQADAEGMEESKKASVPVYFLTNMAYPAWRSLALFSSDLIYPHLWV